MNVVEMIVSPPYERSFLTTCRGEIVFVLPPAARNAKLVFPCRLAPVVCTVQRARLELTTLP